MAVKVCTLAELITHLVILFGFGIYIGTSMSTAAITRHGQLQD